MVFAQPVFAEDTVPASTFLRCDSSPATLPASKHVWVHRRNKVLSRVGSPRHEISDAISLPGKKIKLQGKFQYGKVRKDLEDETIDVWISSCKKTWTKLGTAKTNDDGWVTLSTKAPSAPGQYRIAMRPTGNHHTRFAYLWVVPKDQKVAIFDLDGTLTVSDKEIQKQAAKALLTTGTTPYVPKAYDGGVELTRAFAKKGVLPIYISGRPYWFGDWTRRWVVGGGYAPGPVFLTRKHRQVAPNNKGVGQFKLGILNKLKRIGCKIVAAHGNAKTDVFAYTTAKIPRANIYIIGPHAGHKKTQAVKSWRTVLKKMIEVKQ